MQNAAESIACDDALGQIQRRTRVVYFMLGVATPTFYLF